jgi:hypothetical protein
LLEPLQKGMLLLNFSPFTYHLLRYGWHQEKDGDDAILTKTFEAAEEFQEYPFIPHLSPFSSCLRSLPTYCDLNRFAWIKKYRDRSVTELEIRHGYLLNECLPEGHVFFYFRDRAYLNNIPDAQLSEYASFLFFFKYFSPFIAQQYFN